MILIAFAPDKTNSPATPIAAKPLLADSNDSLLNTSFKEQLEPKTILVSKTVLVTVAKVYLLGITSNSSFWAKDSGEGTLLPVDKEDALLSVIKEARDVLVEEKVNPVNSNHPVNKLINLLDALDSEVTAKQKESKKKNEDSELDQGVGVIFKKLTEQVLDQKLKDLIFGAIAEQKEIYQNYLNEQTVTPVAKKQQEKEQAELKKSLAEITNFLETSSSQIAIPQKTKESIVEVKETEIILDPWSYSLPKRESLVQATKTATRELEKEAPTKEDLAKVKSEKNREAELRVLRDYLAKLDPDTQINYASALYKRYQAKGDPVILAAIRESLTNTKEENKPLALAS